MADGDRRTQDMEEAALSEAVKKFTFLKTMRLREVELLEAEVVRKAQGLEGFLSIVTRVEVSYRCDGDPKRHRVSLIVKKMPPNGFQSDIIRSCRAYERERAFYESFVPMLRRVLREFPSSWECRDSLQLPLPDFLHASSKGHGGGAGDLIVLEDLCAKGYRLPRCVSKVRGLDLDHCLVAMRVIGRFHALAEGGAMLLPGDVGWPASLVHQADRLLHLGGLLDKLFHHSADILPRLLRRLKRFRALFRTASAAEEFLLPPGGGDAGGGVLGMIPELSRDAMWYNSDRGQEPSIFLGVVEKRLVAIREIAKELDGLPRKAEESGRLGPALEDLWSVLNRSVRARRSGWNVLNHGDCWINNLLFRYERGGGGGSFRGKPKDAKLIDLQFARYCHPGIDLLYFLYTSTQRPFRELHFDLLVSEYHSSLTQTLKAIGCDPAPISLEDLKSDLRGEYQPFGVIIGTVFAPYLKLEASESEEARDAHEVFIKDGNSSSALRQFRDVPEFRSFMEENVRELTEVIFPGGLEFVNPYWM